MRRSEFLGELANLMQRNQVLEALDRLRSVSTKLAERLGTDRQDVRREVKKVLDAAEEYLETDTGHVLPRILSIIQTFNVSHRLLGLSNKVFHAGDYAATRQILTCAIRTSEDHKKGAIAMARHRGHELIKDGRMLDAFDFFETADSFVPLRDSETHEPFTVFADARWAQALPDCADGDQFVSQQMPKIMHIYEALNRPDRLYSLCGHDLKQREDDFLKQQLTSSNGDFPGHRGWSAHVIDAYHRALHLAVPMGDYYALKEPQIRDIGDTMRDYCKWGDAYVAYFRIGDWERMETLGTELLKRHTETGDFKEGIRCLSACVNRLEPTCVFSAETTTTIKQAMVTLLQTQPIVREGYGRHRKPIESRKKLEDARAQYVQLKQLYELARTQES